jgi:hypothetical protein
MSDQHESYTGNWRQTGFQPAGVVGWRAFFKSTNGTYWAYEVAGWLSMLDEDGDTRFIAAITDHIGEPEPAERHSNFLGILGPADPIPSVWGEAEKSER